MTWIFMCSHQAIVKSTMVARTLLEANSTLMLMLASAAGTTPGLLRMSSGHLLLTIAADHPKASTRFGLRFTGHALAGAGISIGRQT